MPGRRHVEITDNTYIIDGLPAVYVESSDAVIIADLHLGYEEAMSRRGVFLPRLQYKRIIRVIREAYESTEASKLIIAGDLKHEFGKLLRQEKLETARLLQEARRTGYKQIIVVRGNHDNFIGPILESLGAEFRDSVELDSKILVTHGHRMEKIEGYKLVIMGHEHPSLQVMIGGAREKFPAALLVPTSPGTQILVLPPSGLYQVGNNISMSKNDYLSPIIRELGIIEDAVPIIVDEQEGTMILPRLEVLQEIV
ncbi:MAG: metallophosphoesterase [Desulfurococcales archaeon]|nr:metallophosphoesterase [Desulfurococcales archaeon]